MLHELNEAILRLKQIGVRRSTINDVCQKITDCDLWERKKLLSRPDQLKAFLAELDLWADTLSLESMYLLEKASA